MSLVKCDKCGDTFDSSLVSCPNCGTAKKVEPQHGEQFSMRDYVFSNDEDNPFVSFTNIVASLVVIVGVIASIYLAKVYGVEGAKSWFITIIIFLLGTLATCINFILIKAISIVIELLTSIENKLHK